MSAAAMHDHGQPTTTDEARPRLVSVKGTLTPTRPKRRRRSRPVETVDFIGMVGRMIRAAGRRVGSADMDELEALLALRDVLDEAIADAVPAVRDNGGYSWAAIGDAAGITRQGAEAAWGRRAQRARARKASTT